jgi:hypothetical protein
MANPGGNFHLIPAAQATVTRRLGLLLFVKGSLREHAPTLDDFFRCLGVSHFAGSLRRQRNLADHTWSDIPGKLGNTEFGEMFSFPPDNAGPWGLELTADEREGSSTHAASLELVDVGSTFNGERASYIRVIFADGAPTTEIATLSNWIVHNFPLWWGTAGWFFHYTAGSRHAAGLQIAAQAKRHWAVQIQDLSSLQWSSLQGIPSVAWLTLLGHEFAKSKKVDLRVLASPIGATGEELFTRLGDQGLVIAAGAKPVTGDINVGESLAGYVRVAAFLEPLFLETLDPLPGPLSKPGVRSSWLRRFHDSSAWLECDISD